MAIRVHQIAKEYSTTSDEVLKILREAGMEYASLTAELDQRAVHIVRARLGNIKLTVVDGDDEGKTTVQPEKVTDPPEVPPEPKKTPRGKKKKAEPPPPPPTMKVRIIKRDQEEESELPEEPPAEAPTAEPEMETEPKKPRLQKRRPRRRVDVQARLKQIQEIADQRSQKVEPKPVESTTRPKTGTEARPAPPARKAAKPAPAEPSADTKAAKRITPAAKRREKQEKVLQGDLQKAFMGRAATAAPPQEKTENRFRQPAFKPGLKKKKKKKKREQVEKQTPVRISTSKVELPKEELGIIMLSEGVTVKELAEKINRMAKDVIKRLLEKGIMATLNDVLERDLAIDVAKDFGYLAEIVSFEEDLQIRNEEHMAQKPDTEEQQERAPIVTIMGHVDHGKTSLLDHIRSSKVAAGEAGGITQHIGAHTVRSTEKPIVFLDTPGHEAFTKMRARGAYVTDIVILVVAADDGVMPQTVEAIQHAKAAKVPIIVAINKIDKPNANPDKVKTALTEHELVIEEFGGDTPCVMVSAKTGEGIQDLLEMILLVAEMKQIRANAKRRGQGTVIEAQLDRGRGPVATIIVQDGTLKVGEYFITGSSYGKVRAMYDDMGQAVEAAGPSTPVEILGLHSLPQAGDLFQVVDDETTARQISSFRMERQREEKLRRQKHISLDQLFSKMNQEDVKELALIIKGDVQGSVEGISQALRQIDSKKVQLRVVLEGVGNVTENDVLLAMASDAIIIGFKVKEERSARELADQENIDIRFYSVIYDIIRDIEEAMLGVLGLEYEERNLGRLVVRQVFQVPRQGKVAGCLVEQGVAKRSAKARIIRNGELLHTGDISSLKRFRDDVNEVRTGLECGMNVTGFHDFAEGDVIEVFAMEAVRPTSLT